MIRFRRSLVLPILLSASFLAASQAAADPPVEVRTMPVRYGDLNLATDEGIAALDRRIRRAVEQVCGQSGPHTLSTFSQERRCRREAWAGVNLERAEAIAMAFSPTRLAARGQ